MTIIISYHMCQHQRTKKRDRSDEKAYKAGVSILPTARGASGTAVGLQSSRHYMDFARATITRDFFIPGPT